MERRNLLVGLMVLAGSLLLLVGSASAQGTGTCNVKSLPEFTAQGEFSTTATVADVIEVGCDPTEYGTGSEVEVVAAQLYSECNGDITWYIPNPYDTVEGTRGVKLKVDADGNATVALIAGPQCQAGESLIAVHEENRPFESVTTSYTIAAPKPTPEGVTALPASQIEDAESSAVATIIEAEFPGKAEGYYRIGSDELFSRCQVDPHLRLITESRWQQTEDPEVTHQQLDNDGNGFVLAIGDSSCYPGVSLIEADLEEKPFTTLTPASFEVIAPEPRFVG